MTDELEESVADKLNSMRQTEIDALDEMKADEIEATDEEDVFSFAYQKRSWKKAKKVTIKTKKMLHTVRLKLTKELWKEADKDEKMFSYLFQLGTMKATFVAVGKKKCNTTFWEFADDEWIENTRQLLFGPNPLEVSPYSEEMLKNLQGEFKKVTEHLMSISENSLDAEKPASELIPPNMIE